jgi:hypothetical protein
LSLSRLRKKAEELLVRPHDFDAPTCDESRHSRQYRLRSKRAQFVPRIMSATRRRRRVASALAPCDFFAQPTVEALHLPRYLAHIRDGVARSRLAKKWNPVFRIERALNFWIDHVIRLWAISLAGGVI